MNHPLKPCKHPKTFIQQLFLRYYEIDSPLRSYFTRNFLLYSLLFLFISIFGIVFHELNATLVAYASILFLFGINVFRIAKCLENDICVLCGNCEEINIPSVRNHPLQRDFVIMRTPDDNYIKIYSIKHYKPKPGNEITIYFPKSKIRRINDDTYSIHELYYLYISKNNGKTKRS